MSSNKTEYRTESFNYDKSLQKLMSNFQFCIRKNVVYFHDKYNPDICFAMYGNQEILDRTKEIRDKK